MKIENKEVLLISGKISKLAFSENKEKAFIKIGGNSGIFFEFQNTAKKRRADHAKKLLLKEGDYCIAAGANSVGNAYSFGYEIEREGTISSGDYILVNGEIEKTIETVNDNIIFLKSEGQKKIIKVTKALSKQKRLNKYGKIAFLCYKTQRKECMRACNEWNVNKCSSCRYKKRETRLNAIDFEMISDK